MTYYQRRRGHYYYRLVRDLVAQLCTDSASILDVGPRDVPLVEWFSWIRDRTVIDLQPLRPFADATTVRGDFMTYRFGRQFDLVTCLQVLEHVPDPAAFAARLLTTARRAVVVSVPYRWPRGVEPEHRHDPVSVADVERWFGRAPDVAEIAYDDAARLVGLFYL